MKFCFSFKNTYRKIYQHYFLFPFECGLISIYLSSVKSSKISLKQNLMIVSTMIKDKQEKTTIYLISQIK